jgi:hypothetical protein
MTKAAAGPKVPGSTKWKGQAAKEMTADSCTASAIVSANTVISAPLALPARTRYNTCGLERPLLWPVLACPPMAGFEVSTEVRRHNPL